MNHNYELPVGYGERMKKAFLNQPNGLTIIARETGLPRTTVYEAVYHARMTNIVVLARLAKYFKVTTDYLLFGEE